MSSLDGSGCSQFQNGTWKAFSLRSSQLWPLSCSSDFFWFNGERSKAKTKAPQNQPTGVLASLLWSTGKHSSVQCRAVPNIPGAGAQGKNTSRVWQKPTQHCKAITLQLKTSKFLNNKLKKKAKNQSRTPDLGRPLVFSKVPSCTTKGLLCGCVAMPSPVMINKIPLPGLNPNPMPVANAQISSHPGVGTHVWPLEMGSGLFREEILGSYLPWIWARKQVPNGPSLLHHRLLSSQRNAVQVKGQY